MGGPEEVADTVVEKVDGGDTENVCGFFIFKLIYRTSILLSC